VDIGELFYQTLSALPCPVSNVPAGGKHETYATFNEVYGEYEAYASNDPQRVYHMVQVHVFSKRDDGTHRELFSQAIELLRAAKVKVRSWGPDEYETDTKYHHIAATCEIVVSV
jgi:alkanesulfonate monooxygenase SsuD/methylene tetrahydromethanopterin reductase-like flavin-dependent oxidoreductase (luciferase family)